MATIDRSTLKKAIFELLEEDQEFRYALMSFLGYHEILNRITRIEERIVKLEERFAKLEERQQKLEEHFARLEERFARLEEEFKKLYERQLALEERQQKLEERMIRLEERQQRIEERMLELEERQQRIEKEMAETRRVLAIIAHRFGILTEQGLREAMKHVIEDILGTARVQKETIYDEEGVVYGHPAQVDIDIVVHNDEHVIVEVKSRASRGDLLELHRIGVLYERKKGVKPRLLLIAGFADPGVEELAQKLGIELKPAIKT